MKYLFLQKNFLIIVPLLLLLTLAYNLTEKTTAPISSIDPEYIHLISSVNLASGQYKLLSIENPASSLYIFGSVVVKCTYFLSSEQDILMDDFFKNPEKYVLSFRIALILTTLFSLFFMGIIVYRYSKNIIQAVFLQVVPFISIEILNACTTFVPKIF